LENILMVLHLLLANKSDWLVNIAVT